MAFCLTSQPLWAMAALKKKQNQIADSKQTFNAPKSESSSLDNPLLSLNNQDLEEVMQQIFDIIEKQLPDDMKYHPTEEKVRAQAEKKDLIDNAIQMALKTVDISPALQKKDASEIKALKNQLDRILHRAFTELNVLPKESALHWCTCPNAPFPLRIALIVRVVNDARKEKNPNEYLGYTSIAAGALLLDYLIVAELIEYGFKEIQVNFIEPEILDLYDIDILATKAEKQVKEPSAHESFINALNASMYLSTFKEKINALAQQKIAPRSDRLDPITIDSYRHETAYIDRARQYKSERTDILMLVDAAGFLYGVKDPIDAHGFVITRTSPDKNNPVWYRNINQFIVFLPSSGPQNITSYSNIELNTHPDMKNLYDKVVEVIRANTSPYSVSNIFRKVVTLVQENNDSLKKSSKSPFYVLWISEAYLVLQDIARQAMNPSGAVYVLSKYDQLKRLDLREVQTAELISSRTGVHLLHPGSLTALDYTKMPSPFDE